jgi:hypothetical protein
MTGRPANIREQEMLQSRSDSGREQVIDTMIELTRLSSLHRSPFLSASAAIAVLIESRESGVCLKIRSRLEQMGFRIEAGVRCQQGLVLSAYRRGFVRLENAA